MEKSTLPSGWTEATLAHLGKWTSGGTPSKKMDDYHSGDISWVLTGDLEDGIIKHTPNKITQKGVDNSSAKIFPIGTLLVAMYGATIGKLGVLGIEAATNQACAALIPNSANQDIFRYVFYYLLFARKNLKEMGQGGAQPNISQTLLKEYPISIAPLNEQKRIVDKIELLFSDMDKGEALLKQVQKQLSTYRKSVLKAAITGELIGKDGTLWPEYNIGRLLSDIRYGTAKKCFFDPSKTPVLRIPNVAGGKIDLSDLKHTDFTEAELAKLRLEAGDLLIVRSNGSVSLVGLSAMVTSHAVGYAYAGYLIRLRLNQSIILPEFLNLFFHSPFVRNKIELQARSTSGVHNINSDEIKALTLRVPSIGEQEEIIDKVNAVFSQIDALENWCAAELIRSATLRQSILKSAFSGKLVPQDPADEPASALLARIQSARVAETATRDHKPKKSKAA